MKETPVTEAEKVAAARSALAKAIEQVCAETARKQAASGTL